MIPSPDKLTPIQLLFQMLSLLQPFGAAPGEGGSRKALLSFKEAARHFQNPPGIAPLNRSVEILESLHSIRDILHQAQIEPISSPLAKNFNRPPVPNDPAPGQGRKKSADTSERPDSSWPRLRSGEDRLSDLPDAPDFLPVAHLDTSGKRESEQETPRLFEKRTPAVTPEGIESETAAPRRIEKMIPSIPAAGTDSERPIDPLTAHLIQQIRSLPISEGSFDPGFFEKPLAIRLQPIVERLISIVEEHVFQSIANEKTPPNPARETPSAVVLPKNSLETTPEPINAAEKRGEGSRFENPQSMPVSREPSTASSSRGIQNPSDRPFQHSTLPAAPLLMPAAGNNFWATPSLRLPLKEDAHMLATEGKISLIAMPFSAASPFSSAISQKKKKDKDKKRPDEEEREDQRD